MESNYIVLAIGYIAIGILVLFILLIVLLFIMRLLIRNPMENVHALPDDNASFIKYLQGSVFKYILTISSLWLFIDYLDAPYKTVVRTILFIIIAILGHYFYTWNGYNKNHRPG